MCGHPGVQGQRPRDRFHLRIVLGLPEAQRAPLPGQLPQPLQMPLPRQLLRARSLARLGFSTAWPEVRPGMLTRKVVRNSLIPAAESRAGLFGWGESGVTSSVRHIRSGIEASTFSS